MYTVLALLSQASCFYDSNVFLYIGDPNIKKAININIVTFLVPVNRVRRHCNKGFELLSSNSTQLPQLTHLIQLTQLTHFN